MIRFGDFLKNFLGFLNFIFEYEKVRRFIKGEIPKDYTDKKNHSHPENEHIPPIFYKEKRNSQHYLRSCPHYI